MEDKCFLSKNGFVCSSSTLGSLLPLTLFSQVTLIFPMPRDAEGGPELPCWDLMASFFKGLASPLKSEYFQTFYDAEVMGHVWFYVLKNVCMAFF